MKAQVEAAETICWGPADAVKKNADLKAIAYSWRKGNFKDTLERVQEGVVVCWERR